MRAVRGLKPRWHDWLCAATGTRVLLGTMFLLGLWVLKTAAQQPGNSSQAGGESKEKATTESKYPAELVDQGATLFQQRCAFCHGRDATGGESGPDLTRSKLVAGDVDGEKIGAVVRNGRPEKGMPPFEVADEQVAALAAFIHTQQKQARSRPDDAHEPDGVTVLVPCRGGLGRHLHTRPRLVCVSEMRGPRDPSDR